MMVSKPILNQPFWQWCEVGSLSPISQMRKLTLREHWIWPEVTWLLSARGKIKTWVCLTKALRPQKGQGAESNPEGGAAPWCCPVAISATSQASAWCRALPYFKCGTLRRLLWDKKAWVTVTRTSGAQRPVERNYRNWELCKLQAI